VRKRGERDGTDFSTDALESSDGSENILPRRSDVADLTVPGGDYDNATLQVRGRHMLPRVRRMAAEAHRRGVRIVAATDTGYGEESVLRMGHELQELVGVGLTPVEAIRSATTVAAELLGIEDRTGRIAPGFEADLIVLDGDPLADVGVFQDVLLVVADGRLVLNRLEW
jgi:imidazolonepropionase-like amidohydrolase